MSRMVAYVRDNRVTLSVFPAFLLAMALQAMTIVHYYDDLIRLENGMHNSITIQTPVSDSQAFGTHAHSGHAHKRIRTIPNCENVDSPTVPCVTWDENEWRLVTDYTPYTFVSLPRCASEDSDNCYWDARNRGNHKGNSFVTVTVNGKRYVVR